MKGKQPKPNPWLMQETGIEDRFRESLVKRAKKRLVKKTGKQSWQILGDAKLGDAYEFYTVVKSGRSYDCTCYGHMYGEIRSKKICSHVLAVIIYERTGGGRKRERPTLFDPAT